MDRIDEEMGAACVRLASGGPRISVRVTILLWLIFMDMVNKQLPTFEAKTEALYYFYFPMFSTWFGLDGLCKLPGNDVEPVDNKKTAERFDLLLLGKGYL